MKEITNSKIEIIEIETFYRPIPRPLPLIVEGEPKLVRVCLKFINKVITNELEPICHELRLPSPIWRGVGGEVFKF